MGTLKSVYFQLSKKIDILLSPPPNYANLTYYTRIRHLWTRIRAKQKPLNNAVMLAQLLFMLGMSYILYPVALLLKKAGYRFINIDLAQIGTVIYLDLLIREDLLTRKTPRHKMLALASHYTEGNKYLSNLYSDYVVFVRNPVLKFLLSPFFVSDVFEDNSFRYDTVVHTKSVSVDVWKRYTEYSGNKPLISFPQKDLEKARALLKPYLPTDQKFVALHVRDSGFYKDPQRNTRNADILTYEKAIKYLISQGYAVVRLGHSSADNISSMMQACGPLLFDYAHSDIRSEMMDCYLISHCAFFIGSAAGPGTVPILFNINSCNVNWYTAANAENFLEGDIATLKKFRYSKNDQLVPFADLMLPPLSRNPDIKTLERIGIYIENNSTDEIYDTVKEFLEMPRDKLTPRQLKARSYIRPDNFSYGAKGAFSNTILKQYPEFVEFKD